MKIYVVSFGTPNYTSSMELLRHSSLKIGLVDGVLLYGINDLSDLKNYDENTFKSSRGYGFWSWKAHIILKAMSQLNDDDLLVYCDACMTMVSDISPYIKNCSKDINLFSLNKVDYNANKYYTKTKTFDIMKCDIECDIECNESIYLDTHQLIAAIQIYRKSPVSIAFLKEYIRYSSIKECIDDSDNYGVTGFIDHRHDQSILTILSIKYSSIVQVTNDPTQYGDNIARKLPQLLDHHRIIHQNLAEIVVITPSVNHLLLKKCIESVQNQNIPNVKHLIVIDGPKYSKQIREIINLYIHRVPIHIIELPWNVGADGWYGYRVYGSMPILCNSHYISYLDEDNFIEPNHLLCLMKTIAKDDLDWTFCLRKITNKQGEYVLDDNCESLGNFTKGVGIVNNSLVSGDYMCDTSTLLLNRQVAVEMSSYWNHKLRTTDRFFVKQLMEKYPNFKGTMSKTLNYSASPEQINFFKLGNQALGHTFSSQIVYLFHFDPEHTAEFFSTRHNNDRSYAFDEWCISMPRDLDKHYTLLDGYLNEHMISKGSIILVHMCMPQFIPKSVYRNDLIKIGCMIESPNIRHQDQWNIKFLNNFNYFLTFWKPLINNEKFIYMPFNTYYMNLEEINQLINYYSTNTIDRSICMVLERRELPRSFEINDIKLECLDHLREMYIQDLDDIVLYGRGWDKYENHPKIHVADSRGKVFGFTKSSDIIKNYTFNLIIENTTAEGYVSEKIYAAWIAGAIPIYYGNFDERLINVLGPIVNQMYIDLKQFKTSEELNNFINSMTNEDIQGYRERIIKYRKHILAKVSCEAYTYAFNSVIKKINN